MVFAVCLSIFLLNGNQQVQLPKLICFYNVYLYSISTSTSYSIDSTKMLIGNIDQ